jgi:uncharacterized protein
MSVPRPIAEPDGTTQVWWDATRERILLVQRCDACEAFQHYPRPVCTTCGLAEGFTFVEASGAGTIVSFTTVHRAPHEAFTTPYVVALVRLDEGPVLLTNIVGGTPTCDGRVRLTWEALSDGRNLPVFEMET